MNFKYPLFILTIYLSSCITIKGEVISSNYEIAIPSSIKFYSMDNNLISEVKTDEEGCFFTKIPKKYNSNKMAIIINPLVNNIYTDTIIKKERIIGIQLSNIKTDTIYVDFCSEKMNFKLKKMNVMEFFEGTDSH